MPLQYRTARIGRTAGWLRCCWPAWCSDRQWGASAGIPWHPRRRCASCQRAQPAWRSSRRRTTSRRAQRWQWRTVPSRCAQFPWLQPCSPDRGAVPRHGRTESVCRHHTLADAFSIAHVRTSPADWLRPHVTHMALLLCICNSHHQAGAACAATNSCHVNATFWSLKPFACACLRI